MRSPQGWVEPGQTPEFEEFTIVLKGMLQVSHKDGEFDVQAGQAVITHPGRVGEVFDARRRWRGVHRGVRSGVRDGDGASR